jgi:hypothetical protein
MFGAVIRTSLDWKGRSCYNVGSCCRRGKESGAGLLWLDGYII